MQSARPLPAAEPELEPSRERARPGERLPVWDLPTRVFHGALVGLIVAAWWTAEQEALVWHRRCGLSVLGLLVFRAYWGLVGSSTSRFSHLLHRPAAVLAYAKTAHRPQASSSMGHNPIAALGTLGLLTLIAVQVGLGLFAVDADGLESGPFSPWVSFETGRSIAAVHAIGFKVLSSLVFVHVTAVLFYVLYKREHLIAAIIRGDRTFASPPSERMRPAPLWRALPGALLALAVVWLVAF